ncbi:hypothetical protein [Pseudomonas nitroreducens]|uniref:hypothetical protein n=1 Tax=Pseudomonas nitroreducens TaxID=46680 RepID=UPI001FB68791|nr:hypothetical protein [Pseudomonas nitroreducens]MCJ1879808.1 hypothetical protein [Pseudomonas nitroreducens]MCJ1896969.1 hypothetical protein [Pseudomonas nitroreducens]
MPLTYRLRRCMLTLALLSVLPLAQAETHESLNSAVESLWSVKQVSTSALGSHFTPQESKAGTEYRTNVKNAPSYLEIAGEAASVVIGSKRFDAIDTPWGNFPRLDMRKTRLLDIKLPKRHYQVLAGPGTGLFGAGDWRLYGFLHVVDVSTPAPTYYPLYAEASLGEHLLGRLPGSAVLNYARLVPVDRGQAGEAEAYEVTLYALARARPEPVLRNGVPLAYSLKHEGDTWVINSVDSTPVTTALDEEKRSFTTPLRPALFQFKESVRR